MIYYEVKRAAFISGAIVDNPEETSGARKFVTKSNIYYILSSFGLS